MFGGGRWHLISLSLDGVMCYIVRHFDIGDRQPVPPSLCALCCNVVAALTALEIKCFL